MPHSLCVKWSTLSHSFCLLKVLFVRKNDVWVSFPTRQIMTLRVSQLVKNWGFVEEAHRPAIPELYYLTRSGMGLKNPLFTQIGPLKTKNVNSCVWTLNCWTKCNQSPVFLITMVSFALFPVAYDLFGELQSKSQRPLLIKWCRYLQTSRRWTLCFIYCRYSQFLTPVCYSSISFVGIFSDKRKWRRWDSSFSGCVCLLFMGHLPSIPSTHTDTHMHSLMHSIPLTLAAKSSPPLSLSPWNPQTISSPPHIHTNMHTCTHMPSLPSLSFPSVCSLG